MYFTKLSTNYSPKNRLQTYVKELVSQLDHLTVEDPATLGEHLTVLVQRANARFPRCTPLRAYYQKAYTAGDYSAGVSDLVQINLYQQRGQFEDLTPSTPNTTAEGIQTTIF